ncbi:MAG: hypothetical protein M3203_06570 [Actinomycetota bacterium]|nr:hypothetical protein [Actinomycetota bacterium]
MQTHVVAQGIREAEVGTDVKIVRPQEQLACSSRVPGLGLVPADRHVVPHAEAADVPGLFEDDRQREPLGRTGARRRTRLG